MVNSLRTNTEHCPRCRELMVLVDVDAGGFARFSCGTCGGVVERKWETAASACHRRLSSWLSGRIVCRARLLFSRPFEPNQRALVYAPVRVRTAKGKGR